MVLLKRQAQWRRPQAQQQMHQCRYHQKQVSNQEEEEAEEDKRLVFDWRPKAESCVASFSCDAPLPSSAASMSSLSPTQHCTSLPLPTSCLINWEPLQFANRKMRRSTFLFCFLRFGLRCVCSCRVTDFLSTSTFRLRLGFRSTALSVFAF